MKTVTLSELNNELSALGKLDESNLSKDFINVHNTENNNTHNMCTPKQPYYSNNAS